MTKIYHHRLNEEQFQPVLEQMLAADREKAEALLKSKGEERMRFGYFDYSRLSFNMFSTGGLVAC